MEARIVRIVVLCSLAIFFQAAIAVGASYRTANFIVDAPTQDLAEKIGKAAERYRRDLAISWTGQAMPNWSRACPIKAEVAPHLGAGGKTSFVFDKVNNSDEVFGWDMNIQGSEERVLDSVLPHEVTHTIFASYFRRPLPRWADEGACTTVEHISERNKQQVMLVNFLRTDHGIAFDKLFAMKEYPQDVLPLYSEGYSLARFLIDQGGRQKFMQFVGEGMKSNNWSSTVNKHYGFSNLQALQDGWLDWVKQGSPAIGPQPGREVLAANDRENAAGGPANFRAQSDDRQSVSAGGNVASTGVVNSAVTGTANDLNNKIAVASNDRGWAAAQNRLTANESADGFTGAADLPRAAANDSTGAGGRSVYDRRSAAGSVAASNPPFVQAPPPAPMASGSDNRLRDPEYVAQRDGSATSSRDHKVLLEWTKPQ